MDLNQLLGAFMQPSYVNSVGSATNSSSADVSNILGAALPMLLAGAQNQCSNSNTSAGFLNALTAHSANDTSDLASFVQHTDLEDGAKIVQHLLGDQSSDIVKQIAKKAGVSQKEAAKVMSAAAPLLMSKLGQELNSQASAQNTSASPSLVSGLLSGMLGGGNSASMLGALLGGGQSQPAPQQQNNNSGLFGALLNLLR